MAVGRAGARLLIREAGRSPLSGRLLQLGPQRVYLRPDQLRVYAAEVGLRPVLDPSAGDLVTADALFRTMGFDEVESADLYDPAADHRIDLNQPVDPSLEGRFDAVYDGGTMEHVFDVPQVLRNVHRLLRVGGRAIHLAPTNNWVDHGFYCFSPRLLWGWYEANGYEIESAHLIRHSRRWEWGRWWARPYAPGALDRWSVGGFEQGMLLTLLIARRTDDAGADLTPQQDFAVPTAPTTPRRLAGLRSSPALWRLAAVVRAGRPPTSVMRLGRRPSGYTKL